MTCLIFIGDEFYKKSGTMMSSLYTEDGRRYDWGFVNRDLSAGVTVNIRPASDEELKAYHQRLNQILQSRI